VNFKKFARFGNGHADFAALAGTNAASRYSIESRVLAYFK
jgi:hypothetical protein